MTNNCQPRVHSLLTQSLLKQVNVQTPYCVVFKAVILESLELRRIHYDLTLTYQIVFGRTVLKCQEFFQLSGCSTTRGHRFKLMKQQRCGYRRHFFANKGWLRGSVEERRSSAGVLSLSCARPVADV